MFFKHALGIWNDLSTNEQETVMSMLRGLRKQENSSVYVSTVLFLFLNVKTVMFFLCTVECYSIIKPVFCISLKAIIRKKANLLKGRVAKPEGTKVRKFDHVSRLPLFLYHHNIWKRCLNRRDSDTFYTIQMCDFKEIQQGHWQILAGVLFVCKNG